MASFALVLLQVSMRGGTGLEWMTVASLVIPAVLIVYLVYYGDKHAAS